MPNPPKPAERKRRLGNPGRRPMPEVAKVTALPQVVDDVPEPLRPLGVDGRAMWDRVWTSGGTWVSQRTDIELVQMACELVDERQALRDQVLSMGDWRDRAALRALESSLSKMLSSLGFSPVERTRMGAGEVRPVSRLDEIRAKAAR